MLDRLPKRLWSETRRQLTAIWSASTRAQTDAAATLLRDWDDLVAFYDFPAEHWRHLRTSNVVESVFVGVRLRTDVAKRARVRANSLYLVFKGRPAPGPARASAQRWGEPDDTPADRGPLPRWVLFEHPARRDEVPIAA